MDPQNKSGVRIIATTKILVTEKLRNANRSAEIYGSDQRFGMGTKSEMDRTLVSVFWRENISSYPSLGTRRRR